MRAEIVLTVAESKRLIARGVAGLDFIREKLQRGTVVVTIGGTDAYVYEELTGQTIDKRAYLSGYTVPAKGGRAWKVKTLPDLVLVNGQPAPELNSTTALAQMQAGDVYIKGANALNYRQKVVGITIGNPTGGPIGWSIGSIISKKLRLLIPVGLEKEVPFDIQQLGDLTTEPDESLGRVHSLWPVHGIIFTELEALRTLCGVAAYPVAAGGIAGAEGGLRLLLVGEGEAVRRAVACVESIQGEPPLGPDA